MTDWFSAVSGSMPARRMRRLPSASGSMRTRSRLLFLQSSRLVPAAEKEKDMDLHSVDGSAEGATSGVGADSGRHRVRDGDQAPNMLLNLPRLFSAPDGGRYREAVGLSAVGFGTTWT